MINNRIDRQEPLFPTWAVGALGAGGNFGLVFWPVQGVSVAVLLACAVLALTVILGMAWQSHVRATRQWSAALEAYADREIARARSRKAVT